ncbi:MAG: pseudaminic acid synthase [Proteobacteria bacterium]|nr:pseudaminic acid synthase [Desulfobulbaceae bacterium]MBU4153809.1 pseudaminic acid synthase [Pseudomonadota bacterium]
MIPSIAIQGRAIGPGHPVYIIAEMSANHDQNFHQALKIIEAAREAGADAVKLQTYTPDTLTIACNKEPFQIKGTAWQGRNLHDLYLEAFTPWEWQPRLIAAAATMGLHCFSTPFDDSAVDFLETIGVPAHKVASFELVDLPLLRTIAATGRPVLVSTGMATLAEIDEAVTTLRQGGCKEIALLKCTSAYPASPAAMNLRTIPHLAQAFGVVTGLSDHTLGLAVPVTAVALGASIIEKHLTLSRNVSGPDNSFSLEPAEFKAMVSAVREAEQALGTISYSITEQEDSSRAFRRSLFVVRDIKAGEVFTPDNLRSIRPGHGLHPRYLNLTLGRKATLDIDRGTPLDWRYIGEALR